MGKRLVVVSETDLAAAVVRHFLDVGAEVYQEVAPWGSLGPRADIVAVLKRVVHVVECKATFGIGVIDQAWYWRVRDYAHRVSIAVPAVGLKGRRDAAWAIMERLGIGLYAVSVARVDYETTRVKEDIAARLCRTADAHIIRDALREEQKTFAAAGNNVGRFWSPFKATCAALREVVEATPGLTWREAMKRVKHHYSSDSSAASTLHRLATSKTPPDALSWLVCTNERPSRLYLADGTAPAPPPTLFAEVSA